MVFANRVDAGRKLVHLRDEPVVVLGLPRGGVPVALEVGQPGGGELGAAAARCTPGRSASAADSRSPTGVPACRWRDLNRQAQAQLQRCENHLTVIPGATHLFEEPGTLQAAAEAARDWLTRHLCPVPHPAR